MRTWLTEHLALSTPVVCAPMAGPGSGRLAAAVSGAGALGMFGVGQATSADQVVEECSVASASGAAYGVGFLAWALEKDPTALDAVLTARPALVSVSFGRYAPFVPVLRAAGILVATQVGSVAEALAAEASGVDLVVARGGEGGGHGRDAVATLPLLQSVLDRVDVPVLAAGGVSTARGLAAVLAAGAAGAWVGTAFLCSVEAGTSPAARRRLLAADETGTGYGRVFDVAQRLDWPREYGGRSLRNDFLTRWVGREDELAHDEEAARELREARARDDFDTAYIYAGQGAGMLDRERPAAEVVADFARADDLLRAAASRTSPSAT